MARTNISVDRKIFDEFAAEAARRNMTLFAFANEAMSAITKISREGGNPDEFYHIWGVLSILRQVDVITLPSDFVEDLIEQLYHSEKAATLGRFSDLGTSVVGLLKMAAEKIEDLSPLAKDFSFFIPIKRFGLSVDKEGHVQVDVVGAGKGMETTECSAEFLKSILVGYGYTVIKQDLHAGTMRLWARKSGQG